MLSATFICFLLSMAFLHAVVAQGSSTELPCIIPCEQHQYVSDFYSSASPLVISSMFFVLELCIICVFLQLYIFSLL